MHAQDVSPLVVYFNPKLIELDRIAEPGAKPVTQDDGWSMEEFRARPSSRVDPESAGSTSPPTLEQIAPFVWSGRW